MIYYYFMKKRYILILTSIILTIAYVDLIDSFKQVDKIISQIVKFESKMQR